MADSYIDEELKRIAIEWSTDDTRTTTFLQDLESLAQLQQQMLAQRNTTTREERVLLSQGKKTTTKCPKLTSTRPIKYYADWMGQLSPATRALPLRKLTIPRTHDAGAYDLALEWDKSDASYKQIQDVNGVNWLPNEVTALFACRLALTQSQDIYHQLKGGIRALDLRTNWDPKRRKWRTAHGLFGDSIAHILGQVRLFLKNHDQEIVIINMSKFHGDPPQEAWERLQKLIVDTFGSLLLPEAKGLDDSIENLAKAGTRVIITAKGLGGEVLSSNNLIWSGDDWEPGWANTVNMDELFRYNNQLVQEFQDELQYKSNALYGFSWTLTPSTKWIVSHVVLGRQNIFNLAKAANRQLKRFWREQKKGQLGQTISVDYFEHSPLMQLLLNNINV